ncbi:hypothetical protein SEA_WHACK_74 [Rhodococcus phage Whack]|uniref:Uncharacterized protein n=1 Tax=Rhodococcus phage Whack TaxID=2591132 RepID=A0A515MKE3_9CAUD|nr:hypothetical protein HWC40_gp74 [Rhodococcus phage Whack]QDM57137.1 hypothetical protein SEA_WHACK_74 [Rhodococcus phage Whack]
MVIWVAPDSHGDDLSPSLAARRAGPEMTALPFEDGAATPG